MIRLVLLSKLIFIFLFLFFVGMEGKNLEEFRLRELLVIGNDGDRNYLFSGASVLKLDQEENIYILDSRNCRVQVFDKKGLFLRTLGAGRGQGPGQFVAPIDMEVDTRQRLLHVLDCKNRKISRFHLDGRFHSDIPLKRYMPVKFFLDPEGNYLLNFLVYAENGSYTRKITKITLDGKMLFEWGNLNLLRKYEQDKRYKQDKRERPIPTPFDPKEYITVDERGSVYYGYSDKYEIQVFNGSGEPIRTIRGSNSPRVEVSQEDKDRFKTRLKSRAARKGKPFRMPDFKFPRYRPVFSGLWVDDGNCLWVHVVSPDERAHIDTFDTAGRYTGRMILEKPGDGVSLVQVLRDPLIKDDVLYSMVMDSDGLLVMKKYKLERKRESL